MISGFYKDLSLLTGSSALGGKSPRPLVPKRISHEALQGPEQRALIVRPMISFGGN